MSFPSQALLNISHCTKGLDLLFVRNHEFLVRFQVFGAGGFRALAAKRQPMKALQVLLVSLLILLLAGSASALPAGALVGTVEAEVPDQVAVYRCRPGPMTGLKPGDVVGLVRSETSLGEATVLRASPELLISLRGLFECAPGDLLVFSRSSRVPERPRPPAPAPAPAPASEPALAPAPEAPPAPDTDSSPALQPEATSPETPQDPAREALAQWHEDLNMRLEHFLRLGPADKPASPHPASLKKAWALSGRSSFLDAAKVYGTLAAALQREGLAGLASDPGRGREAWSLGLEALSLRALCLFLAETPDRARAAFEALARENPKGAMGSARALSTVRARANTWLVRLPRRGEEAGRKGSIRIQSDGVRR